MVKGGIKYHGVGEKGIPLTMKEICLIHLQNLSFEIVTDGLGQEYEPAVDMLMDLLAWEFVVHHGEDKVPLDPEDRTFKEMFDEVMARDFGNVKITDTQKAARIRDKRRLLSMLLASHKIHLGSSMSIEEGSLTDNDLMQLIPEEDDEDGLPPESGQED